METYYYRCPHCDVSFCWPLGDPNDALELFDDYEWTASYSDVTENAIVAVRRALKRKLQVVTNLNGGREVRSMLDVGCGNGIYMRGAEALGIAAVGTEVDGTNVQRGRQEGLDVRHGFLEDIEMRHGAFDFIHIRHVLHLSLRPAEMLRKVRDCLGPAGIVYLDVTNQDGLASRVRKRLQPRPSRYGQIEPPSHCLGYSRRSLDYLLGAVGLRPLRTFTYSYGDRVYYPRLGASPLRGVRLPGLVSATLRVVDFLNKGGFLAAYCRRSR